MIVYQLRFKNLPRFEKFFASEDALFAYLDAASPQAGKPIIKVREIPAENVQIRKAN